MLLSTCFAYLKGHLPIISFQIFEMNLRSLSFVIFALLASSVCGTTRYSSEKILNMCQELRSIGDLRQEVNSVQDLDLAIIVQSVLDHNIGIDIPAALKFYLIRYFERRGEFAPQTLFADIPRNNYFDHLSTKAVLQEMDPENEPSNVDTVLLLLNDGFKIKTNPYLLTKICKLISKGFYSHAKLLFQRLDKENVPSAILNYAINSNNLDLVEFILVNTESFDFLLTGGFADIYIVNVIYGNKIEMLNLLMEHVDKLVFTPQIARTANFYVEYYQCNEEMAARINEIFPYQEQETLSLIEQITLEEQSQE